MSWLQDPAPVFSHAPLSLSVRTPLLYNTSLYPVAAPHWRARGLRSPGTVALLLAEMERANAALPAGTQEVDLGQLGCIVGAVVDAAPGCLGLQDQVAGIITRTCARGAQRGEAAPGSVLEVAAATEAGWEVELAALGFRFGWRSGPTPPPSTSRHSPVAASFSVPFTSWAGSAAQETGATAESAQGGATLVG